MLLSVTPDPVLDQVLTIDAWQPGANMTVRQARSSVGGKGLDASVALRCLGQETTALAFLAGDTGRDLARLVTGYGIHLEAVWAAGETRCARLISELENGRISRLFSGGVEIGSAEQVSFLTRLDALLEEASWLLCGGRLPACLPVDFYCTLAQAARRRGVFCLVDSFESFLLEALPARPAVVKLNDQEFVDTFGVPANQSLPTAARGVWQHFGLETLIVTCGAQGLLALTPEGAWRAAAPAQTAVNPAGAGDAASAAIAWRRSLGDPWMETLRWAAAVSAAAVLTLATAECRQADVGRLLPLVQVTPLDGEIGA